jgi:hypothetical protein
MRTTASNGLKKLLIGARRQDGIIGQITRFDWLNAGSIAIAFAFFPMAGKTIR